MSGNLGRAELHVGQIGSFGRWKSPRLISNLLLF